MGRGPDRDPFHAIHRTSAILRLAVPNIGHICSLNLTSLRVPWRCLVFTADAILHLGISECNQPLVQLMAMYLLFFR